MRAFSAPGKLLLAGEYAVLQPGGSALVVAVERRLVVRGEPAKTWCVESGALCWSPGQPVPEGLSFVAAAVDEARARGAVARLLRCSGEMSIAGRKLGLGSSAAIAVAALAAALDDGADGDSGDRETRWRLADALHRDVQGGRGSGVDVAASHWGGVVRFRRAPLQARRATIHPEWKLLLVRAEASVRTAPRVASFEEFARARPDVAQRFVGASEEAVTALESALAHPEASPVAEAVRAARAALQQLQRWTGLEQETPLIARAADLAFAQGGAGKQSGAGGGDCAVLLALGEEARQRLLESLTREGIEAFAVERAEEGVRVEPG